MMITDPVEKTLKYKLIQNRLEKKIIKRIGKGGQLGYCHLYWKVKKNILKKDYHIDWKSPAELNPDCHFD